MSNFIKAPYIFKDDEYQVINIHFKKHEDWSKAIFNSIKWNVIDYLRQQQNNKCCYCKQKLNFDIRAVEIDHIAPKSLFYQFTFQPYNLALTCPGCNTKKSSKNVLNSSSSKYPHNGSKFSIVHAHFDNYYDHIDFLDDCIYIAKSKKGSETITVCELFRLREVTKRVKQANDPKPALIIQLIEELKKGDSKARGELFSILKESLK